MEKSGKDLLERSPEKTTPDKMPSGNAFLTIRQLKTEDVITTFKENKKGT